jgi:MYXO-CTERM domain-containing protein
MKTSKFNKVGAAGRFLSAGMAAAVLFGVSYNADAVLLVDGNSTMNIDPTSPLGANSWTVEGQNQLFSQWFYYGIGSSAEMSIDNLGTPTVSSTANSATIGYSSAQFDLSITYLLTGGAFGSGTADLNEDIAIINKTGGALDFHIFQYSNFDLEDTPGGDNVQLFPGTSPFSLAYQWENNTGLSESVVQNNPQAHHGDVGFVDGSPGSILGRLTDGSQTTLTDWAGPVGPGDVDFAFQWDFLIGAGDTATISKQKNLNINVIPEPSSAALGLLGLGLLAARRLRRS